MRPTLTDRIDHIVTAIDDIQHMVAGFTRESFANDLIVRLAAERLLEIISEASRYIPAELKVKEPGIDWRGLADLGNWLRQAYHRTDADLLWNMVERDLKPLKNFAEQIAKEAKP